MSRFWLHLLPIALLIFACLFFQVWPQSKTYVALVTQGQTLAQLYHYNDALVAYQRASVRVPGSALPYQARGRIYTAQGRHAEAWTVYLDAVRLGGRYAGLASDIADLYLAQDEASLAAELLEGLVQRRSRQADLWERLARAYKSSGSLTLAISAFEQALVLSVDESRQQRINYELALVHLEDQDLSLSFLTPMQAAQSGPDPALAEKAVVLAEAFSRALDQGRVATSSAQDALARLRLGQVLLQQSQLELARHQFQAALQAYPEFIDGQVYLGYTLGLLGDADQSVHYLQKAVSSAPDHPLPHYFLGMQYTRQGGWVTARDELLQAHDLDPDNPAICAAIAENFILGSPPLYSLSERWWRAAVDKAPDDPNFHLLLARFYVDYGVDPFPRGVAVAQVAVSLAPENSLAHETLGWALYLGGLPDEALESLNRARDLAPQEPRIYYRLGQAYRQLGRQRLAQQNFQQAFDLDWHGPVGDKARRALGQSP